MTLKNAEKYCLVFIFLLVTLVPVAVINHHAHTAIFGRIKAVREKASNSLTEELKEFRSDLIPRSYLHKIIKRVERRTGLVAETEQKPVFSNGVDPKLFGPRSVQNFREAFRQMGGIDPAMLVTFGVDGTNLAFHYGRHYSNFSEAEKLRYAAAAAVFSTQITPTLVFEKNAQTMYNLFNTAQTQHGFSSSMMAWDLFFKLVSSAAYLPRNGESVFEMPTDRNGSHQAFCYYRAFVSNNQVYGGYFVIFFSEDIKPQMILKNAVVESGKGAIRFFSEENKAKVKQNHIVSLHGPIPVELVAYNRLFGSPVKIPDEIGVFVDVSNFSRTQKKDLARLSFVSRIIALMFLFAACRYLLFGFPCKIRLHSSMFLAICLVVLLPYLILGYFSGALFKSFEQFSIPALKSDAESFMFSLENYFFDQKQQNLLKSIQSKERLIKFAGLPEEEFKNIHPHLIVEPGIRRDLSFYRYDGLGITFRGQSADRTEILRADSFLGVRFLDNLRVLDKGRKEVDDLLNYSSLAEGFVDTLKSEYSDHSSVSHEGYESPDLTRIDDFSRFIYYLIPDVNDTGNKILGICFTLVNNLTFVIYNPLEFDLRIFGKQVGNTKFSFAMGQRRLEDYLMRWWPESLNPDSRLRQLLEETIDTRAGGSRLRVEESGEAKFSLRSFFPREQMVFAGIATRTPDPVLADMIRFYPLVVAVFALICVVLFTRVLTGLFVSPVDDFRRAFSMVENGDYRVRIKMARSDEFSQLAESFNRMTEGLAQREKMRRFMSEDLYEKLGETSELNSLHRASFSHLTLLASDIRGFTSISEKRDPGEVVKLLNDYFTAMETAITGCGGVIARFVGDAVLAVFYADEFESSEVKAVKAAVAMRKELDKFNLDRQNRDLFTINNGIGIASGFAASGFAGSEQGRMVFLVIGKVLELAEKLESATRNVESGILICPETCCVVRNQFVCEDALPETGIESFIISGEVLN